MTTTNTFLIAGDLLWPDGAIRPGQLVVVGQRIASMTRAGRAADLLQDRPVIRVPDGGVAAPGFIDLQINGAFGHDFTTNPFQIASVARNLPRFGVTSFLPTLISAPLDQYTAAISAVKGIKHEPEMALVLGLHIEGPYLNRAKAGAHPVQRLRKPDVEELLYFDAEVVKLMTLAPELPGALPFIHALRERGILVGLGHSTATYEETLTAVEAGASWAAHVFNAMGMLHHRHPGIVGAVLSDERLRVGLVADTSHVHHALMCTVAAAKRTSGVTLVSDAVAAAGMPPGTYSLGGQQVTVDAKAVRLVNGTLAGSLSMLDNAVRNMVNLASRPLGEALQMASQTPADMLGIANKGKLAPGCDADLVILDKELRVILTVVQGSIVYRHDS